jgi:hypothetical protein
MNDTDLRAELARVTKERDELLRWKRWTVAREMVLVMGKSMNREDREQSVRWHFALTRYGVSLRCERQGARLVMSVVQDKLGIPAARLSGVELSREPPLSSAMTRRLCRLIGVDPKPLLRERADALRAMMKLAGSVRP